MQGDQTPVISVTNFDDLSPRKHLLLRETVKRFRSLSGQRRKIIERDQNINGSFCESGGLPYGVTVLERDSSENFWTSEIVRESVRRFRKPISRRLSDLRGQESEIEGETENRPEPDHSLQALNSTLPDLLIGSTANGTLSSLGLS